MKTLIALSSVAIVTIALASFGLATKVEARRHGQGQTYVRVPARPYNRYPVNYNGYDPRYDVWGRLVGSDPNNPVFKDAATANLPWNTPNNFNQYP